MAFDFGLLAPLIGGLFTKKPKQVSPADARAGDIMGIRQGAEAAGFNPLAFVGTSGPGGYTIPGDNTMGQAIADTVTGLAAAWSKNAAQKAQAQQLQQQNSELQRKVTVQTIRPEVGGLYDRAPQGTTIPLTSSGPGGWVPEWSVDFAGKQVRQPKPDGTYDSRNPARTVIQTPVGETTPANISDAEDWEMRYGDPVSWAVGMGNLAADAGTSLRTYTDNKGWTDPSENLVTQTLPRLMGESVAAWKKRTAAAKKERRKMPGFGTQSGAYEGWGTNLYGKGAIFQ